MNHKADTARRLTPRAEPAPPPATAPCWLCQGLGGVAVHEKWSAERGNPLWTAHAPGSTLHPVYPCPACTSPRASQAATATNGARDDTGAAHDPHRGSAGRTERIRPEDAPGDLVAIGIDAWSANSASRPGNWSAEKQVRAIIAAIIPAIRAQALADVRADLVALRHKIREAEPATAQDLGRMVSSVMHLTEAISAVDRIARGEQ